MKEYFHIVYKESISDFYSKGENIEAESIEDALKFFRDKYPDATYVASHSCTIINDSVKNKS